MIISKSWHKDPNWFFKQSKSTQIKLLAIYRLENETPEEAKKRKNRYYRKNRG